MWYVLAAANAISDADLVAGTTLKAPEVKTTANDATTFKPYDPSKIEGSTTPSLPYITPPPKKQCDTFLMVFIVIVAIVVSVVTWGAASGAMAGAANTAAASASAAAGGAAATATTGLASASAVGGMAVAGSASLSVGGTMLAGAAAGAAGAAASGVLGSMTGTSSFSWRNVAAGAITGALTAGLASKFGTVGDALNKSQYLKAGGLALANAGASAAGQLAGGGSFSWRGIAANAVSSVVSAGISNAVGLSPNVPFQGAGSFGADFANNMIGGVVSLHVRRAFGFNDAINYGNIAADAFGNALSNAMACSIQTASTLKSLTSEQRANYEEMVKNGIPKVDALKYAQQTPGPVPDYLKRSPADDDLSTEEGLRVHLDNVIAANAGRPLLADNAGKGDPLRYAMNGPDVMDEAGRTIDLGNARITINGYTLPTFNEAWQAIRGIPNWIQHAGEGFSDGVRDLFVSAGTWIGTQAAKFSLGEKMAFDQMGMFMLNEGLTAVRKGFEATETGKFINDSGLTLEYFINHPDQLVYALADQAERWWDSRTPDQRAYSIGHIAGETVALYGLTKVGEVAIRAPSAINGLRASIPISGERLLIGMTDRLFDAYQAGRDTSAIAGRLAETFTKTAPGPRSGSVILGRFTGRAMGKPVEGLGYQDFAKNFGGTYFDTGDVFFERLVKRGLAQGMDERKAYALADKMAFKANEQFILQQARAGAPEFRFANTTVNQAGRWFASTATFGEMRMLNSPALQALGYVRKGNSWIKVPTP